VVLGASSHWLWTGESGDSADVWQSAHEVAVPAAAWQLGMSVYTSLAWPVGPQTWQAHWQRLMHDAQAMGLAQPPAMLLHAELLARFPQPSSLRVSLVAMAETLGALLKQPKQPTPSQLWVTQRALGFADKAWLRAPHPPSNGGLRLKTEPYSRPWPQIKHGNIGIDMAIRRQAMAAGFDDVVWVNPSGHLSEASTANLFVWQDDRWLTPDPHQAGCLPGVTRQQILEMAKALGVLVSVASVDLATLASVQGAFLTNAVQGVRWVHQVNATPLDWSDAAWSLTQQFSQAWPTQISQ
jgi:branched-subunit amino acid aminotransferase/4-amino-4-deoxychorismate lyase